MSNSDIFNSGVPIYIKIIGFISLSIFILFIGFGFYLFFTGSNALIHRILEQGTLLMTYAVFYNIGYLISIWKPIDVIDSDNNVEFEIKLKLSLWVLGIMGLYLIVCFFLFFFLTKEFLSIFFVYFSLGGAGLGVGWIFWEHLKETSIFTGKFLRQLKILSIIFEISLIVLMIIGIYSHFVLNSLLDKILLISYLLLFYLIATYFIGLLWEIITK
ncbi:MAG: hypothetical protein ACTSR8_10155 [Promethearchaeota archaeon]